ncbi:MAG: hypothetical protein SCK70_00030 [bacterium]|nr:hypothetical protein [bacterium]
MHTLHEFFARTIASEYLIAVTFLIVFPVFWIFLNKKKKTKKLNAKKDHN